MATKKNYKPLMIHMVSMAADSVPVATKTMSVDLWDLLLLQGMARLSDNAAKPLLSAAVVLWLSGVAGPTTDDISTASYITFTNSQGRYAVTVPTKQGFNVKVYS